MLIQPPDFEEGPSNVQPRTCNIKNINSEQKIHQPSLRHKMPGGRKKNTKKRTQEEEEDGSKNLRRSLANHGFSAEMSDHIVRAWPGREPFNTPEKETRAQAKECGVCKPEQTPRSVLAATLPGSVVWNVRGLHGRTRTIRHNAR